MVRTGVSARHFANAVDTTAGLPRAGNGLTESVVSGVFTARLGAGASAIDPDRIRFGAPSTPPICPAAIGVILRRRQPRQARTRLPWGVNMPDDGFNMIGKKRYMI